MKARINGIVVECSVEEFQQLTKNGEERRKNSEPTKEPTPKKVVVVKKYKRRLKKENKQKYKEAYDYCIKTGNPLRQGLEKVFTDRVVGGSDYTNLRKIIGKHKIDAMLHRHPEKKKQVIPNKQNIKVERGKFVAQLANDLIREGIARKEAWKEAAQKWNKLNNIVSGKKPPKPDTKKEQNNNNKYMLRQTAKVPNEYDQTMIKKANQQTLVIENFPNIYPIHPDSMLVLRDIVKQAIADCERITYYSVKDTLRLMNDQDFTPYQWRTFVQQFLLNKKKVADYFMIHPNRIKITLSGKYHYIDFNKK